MSSRRVAVLAAAISLAAAAAPAVATRSDHPGARPGAREVPAPATRLLVADGVEGRLRLLDLARGRVVAGFGAQAPVRVLVTAGDRRHVFSGQPDGDRVASSTPARGRSPTAITSTTTSPVRASGGPCGGPTRCT